MAKYKIGSARSMWDKEYTSIVDVRKAAIDALSKSGARWCRIYQYSQKHGKKWYQIGDVEWPGESFSFIYSQDKMGMPRPNNIKDGQWVLDKKGRIICTVSEFNRRRQKMWSKRYGN